MSGRALLALSFASAFSDYRPTCLECGGEVLAVDEDHLCRTCRVTVEAETAARPTTPELVRGWIATLERIKALHAVSPAAMQCTDRLIAEWRELLARLEQEGQ